MGWIPDKGGVGQGGSPHKGLETQKKDNKKVETNPVLGDISRSLDYGIAIQWKPQLAVSKDLPRGCDGGVRPGRHCGLCGGMCPCRKFSSIYPCPCYRVGKYPNAKVAPTLA